MHRTIWTYLKLFGHISADLDPFEPFQTHFDTFRTIQTYLNLFIPIWTSMKESKSKSDPAYSFAASKQPRVEKTSWG